MVDKPVNRREMLVEDLMVIGVLLGAGLIITTVKLMPVVLRWMRGT